MKTIALVFMSLFFSLTCWAQTVRVGCDCLHNAGTVSTTGDTERLRLNSADRQCVDRLADIPGEEDISMHIEPVDSSEDNRDYACIAIHYVFGFGADETIAKQNAQQTCSLLVRDDRIVSAQIQPEGCKIL